MIHGFHFIFSAYGFWLPNDPRGSWSETVRNFDLLQFGSATKVTTTRSVAAAPHDHRQRLAAKAALRYPPVKFTGKQAVEIAHGFKRAIKQREYVVHALAILRDHVHMVMAYHARHIDVIAKHLKSRATSAMAKAGIHPLKKFVSQKGRTPSPWSRNHWCPFIDSREHMLAAIRYVEQNPVRAGLRPQRWSLVALYEG